MNVAVLGCGRWGSFLTWYADKIGHATTIWGREGSSKLKALIKTRKNEHVELRDSVIITDSLKDAVEKNDIIIISISAQALRELTSNIKQVKGYQDKKYILCMKGLEAKTGKRLSQVFKEEMGANSKVAVWIGPGHVQDFVHDIPSCMIMGSEDIELTKELVDIFTSNLIRFYYGQDMIGNEIGAATKNVIGIAAGMLDGLNYTSLKGSLMARGTREISKLVRAMGGNDMTIYGLCHLGDYEATLFSPYSNNRKFGEDFVKHVEFSKLAEGVATTVALKNISTLYGIELPICNALYDVIIDNKDVSETLLNLFLRPVKFEL